MSGYKLPHVTSKTNYGNPKTWVNLCNEVGGHVTTAYNFSSAKGKQFENENSSSGHHNVFETPTLLFVVFCFVLFFFSWHEYLPDSLPSLSQE